MNTIVPRQDFYVYILRRNGLPFYIGKGRENRLEQHFICAKRRASCKHLTCRVIRKEWREGGEITSEKVCEDVFEQTAFRVECLMIRVGIASSWPLVNQTLGGEGLSGYKHPPEIQAKIKATRLRNLTPEKRAEYGQFSKQMWSDPEFQRLQKIRNNTPEVQAKRLKGAKKTKNAKTYEGFVSPDGTIYAPVHNLTAFCKEHGLVPVSMLDVANGKYIQNKGWTRYPPLEREPKIQPKRKYQGTPLLSPDGIIYNNIADISAFCHERGLRVNPMLDLEQGEVSQVLGWTRYPPKIEVRAQHQPQFHIYRFVAPDGTIHEVSSGINAFCREHELNRGCMAQLHSGVAKSHKGWTKYNP